MTPPPRTSAVVLVAGRGSRLGSLTDNKPKCLTSVAGRTILERLMSALCNCGVKSVVLVLGYKQMAVKTAVAEMELRPEVRFVLNADYDETGTASSLQLGLSAAISTDDVVVIEGDMLFDSPVLREVISQRTQAATAVARWRPEYTGTFTVLHDGRVIAWVHESRRPEGFLPPCHYKAVNITRFSNEAWMWGLQPAITHTLAEDGRRAPAEYAFHRLVTSGNYQVQAVTVDNWNWWEIDTQEDLRIASELFREHTLLQS